MQCDYVAPAENLIQRHEISAPLPALARRVVEQHLHAESRGGLRHLGTHIAYAHHAEGLSLKVE